MHQAGLEAGVTLNPPSGGSRSEPSPVADLLAGRARQGSRYVIAKEIARKALNLQLPDRTGGALYFHHGDVAPGWSKEYIKIVEVSPFVFYKPKGDDAR